MIQGVKSLKEQWDGLEPRLRDLGICYIGLVLFMPLAVRLDIETQSIPATMATISVLVMWLATLYYFWRAGIPERYQALRVTALIGIASLLIAGVYGVATGIPSQNLTDDLVYLVFSAPFAAAVSYWIVGGFVMGVGSIVGLASEEKDEDEIINEVLGEDE